MTSHMVPDFLIIGAMKAGTTTLYRDLAQHPDIFLPQEKEPETLVRFGEDDRAILRDYQSLFRPAVSGQILGEASTAYAKRPDHEGVAERARSICGPGLKIIYLTREPISRIVSQYRHERALGLVAEPLNEAVLIHPRYLAYSRYDWQLEPWLVTLPAQNVMRVRFEDYIADRKTTVDQILRFIGAAPWVEADYSVSFNTAEGKRVPKGIWKTLVQSRFYQRQVKPIVPVAIRERLAERVLMPARRDDSQLDSDTRQKLLSALQRQAVTNGAQ